MAAHVLEPSDKVSMLTIDPTEAVDVLSSLGLCVAPCLKDSIALIWSLGTTTGGIVFISCQRYSERIAVVSVGLTSPSQPNLISASSGFSVIHLQRAFACRSKRS